ncbi:hypothetical protein CC78DRAFT_573496 [Lojkania enalia]|uniref:Uncharacterized protein n=1 Tax=Lojkania enalia TaxID=147567 RepID=A0A9P4TS56_9PLEO|nr:hypothetical protein CC78DRAFT_573496 [Didymosphaeria enalia]
MVDFRWLGGPPAATATLNAQPILFVDLLVSLVGCILLILICWFIHYRTGKNNGTYSPWWKNLKKAEEESTFEYEKANVLGRCQDH